MKTPLLLETKRMSIYDGPGIRTTFFVKGCPLTCLWCHNPESISPRPQLAKFRHLCIHCKPCTGDEATCPTRALKLYGQAISIEKLVAKALEDQAFYQSTNGGVTLSGGEPLLFPEWTFSLLKAFKTAGLHTCLDTSLFAKPETIEKLLPVVDQWLPDYKAHDENLHKRCTGVSNKLIQQNLEYLVRAKAEMEVRCLVVPGYTDGEDIRQRHHYLKAIGIPKKNIINLEYFDYSRSKYLALGLKDTLPPKRPAHIPQPL